MIHVLALLACGEKNIDSGRPPTSSDDTGREMAVEPKTATEAFRVPERPWDLALAPDGRIYCSAQGGNKVYIWDPTTQTRTESRSIPDVQNILFDTEGTLYFTSTDNGVTGALSKIEGNQITTLYTQADDGTLMRWPMDFVQTPNPEWIIADYQQGLFVIDAEGAVTTRSAGTGKPQGLRFVNNTLYIAGEDGIFRISWPNGSPERIDERSGLSLLEVNGAIWSSNAELGLFEVGGEAVGLSQAARPGSLLNTSDGIYFADHVGEGVWFYEPAEN